MSYSTENPNVKITVLGWQNVGAWCLLRFMKTCLFVGIYRRSPDVQAKEELWKHIQYVLWQGWAATSEFSIALFLCMQ